ncbi:MAG: PP2C family serine/threonine-protein phosphatase [Candidatus Uhrbacteria bacterium]|nr:PP2C family serine/threonine-protein phosphatase [Candidatus Uhrbacteria bacterium]
MTKRKVQPPPLPAEALAKRQTAPLIERALTWTRRNQMENMVPAFAIPGFERLGVAMSMEKKADRRTDEPNEDNALVFPVRDPRGCIKLGGILADGAGGEANGAEASEAAVQNANDALKKALAQSLTLTAQEAERKILAHQETKFGKNAVPKAGCPDIREMLPMAMLEDPRIANSAWAAIEAMRGLETKVAESGGITTADVFLIHEAQNGARFAILASLGDSPAYIRSGKGEIRQITQDDSLMNALLNQKRLQPEDLAEIQQDPRKRIMVSGRPMNYAQLRATITGALGGSRASTEPSLVIVRLEPGEELLIVSDAMDKLENAETGKTDTKILASILAQGQTSLQRLNLLRKVIKNPTLLGDAAKRLAQYKKDDDFAGVLITAQ